MLVTATIVVTMSGTPLSTNSAMTPMNEARSKLAIGVHALPAPRRLTVSPRIEPAQGDAEHAGHRGGAVAGLIRSHELERFPGIHESGSTPLSPGVSMSLTP